MATRHLAVMPEHKAIAVIMREKQVNVVKARFILALIKKEKTGDIVREKQ